MRTVTINKYLFEDDGLVPNSSLPVVIYKAVLNLPRLLPAAYVKKKFRDNGWTNNWKDGIYTYQHYHSITHEAMGVIKGTALIRLGGKNGKTVTLEKGDVIIIPAGVAHLNLGHEDDVVCVAGYPDGRDFDMNYGRKEERKKALHNIASLPLPGSDPVFGKRGVVISWNNRKKSTTAKT